MAQPASKGGGRSAPTRRWAHRRGDFDIFVALKLLESGGNSLAFADERFKHDRDFILYAVQWDAEALLHVADRELLENKDFAFEAVWRNPEALRFLPEVHRDNPRVVAAAVAFDLDMLRLARPTARADPAVVEAQENGEKPFGYDGEHLLLTGAFNGWITVDSRCRLLKLTSKAMCSGSLEWPLTETASAPAPPPLAPGSSRHRLVALLPTGCISFQLVSCAKGERFHIFPVETYRHEPLRLVCGQPSAVPARIGSKEESRGKHFCIYEANFAVVSIYVEVLKGTAAKTGPEEGSPGAAGTHRGAAVWFVFEPLRARWRGAVEIHDHDSYLQCSRAVPGGKPELPAIEIVPRIDCSDEDLNPETRDLFLQMCKLCRRTPEQHWDYIQALSSGLYLAVVVERIHGQVIAFCRYDLMESANHVADERFDPKRSAFMPCAPPCLVIEHIEVLERRRGLGLGRLLIQRLVKEARAFRCGAIKLISVSSARGFYERLGFEAKYLLDNEQTWREIEPKELPGHEVETRASGEQDEAELEADAMSDSTDAIDDPHMRSWLLENERLPVAMELRLTIKPPW